MLLGRQHQLSLQERLHLHRRMLVCQLALDSLHALHLLLL
jgi:hypothetical protein